MLQSDKNKTQNSLRMDLKLRKESSERSNREDNLGPSADEWIRKLCIYTMEYYLAIKKSTFESVLMRWMKLEPIIQSEFRKKNINTVY